MKVLYFLFLLMITGYTQAQQIPIFSQSTDYNAIVNPAVLNMDNQIYAMKMENTIRISARKQWTMIDDAPVTGIVQYVRELENLNMLGGITLISDKTGPTSITGGFLRYAYQVKPDNYSTISIGLAGGFYQYRYNGDQSLLRDANDVVGLESISRFVTDFKLGIFYTGVLSDVDMIYGGLALPQLANVNVDFSGENEDFFVYRSRHLFANVGYIKFLDGVFEALPYDSYIDPSLEIRYAVNAPIQITGNIRLMLSSLFWIGTGYSVSTGQDIFSSDNLHVEVGFIVGENFDNDNQIFKISYGYDQPLNDFSVRLGSTHEINLSYAF